MARSAQIPSEDQLARAATILNSGKKTAILAGRGALDAGAEVLAAAERLGAPVIKPLLGKGAIADDSPFATGGIGLLGMRPSQDALESCDTLLPLHLHTAKANISTLSFFERSGAALRLS